MGILDSLEGGWRSLGRGSGRHRPVQNLGIADALQWRQEQDLRQRRFDAEEAERQRQKEIADRDFGIQVAEDRSKTMGDISKATLAGGRAAGEAFARQQSGYNEQTGRSEPYQVDTTGGADTTYSGDLAGELNEPSGILGTGGEEADPGTFVSPLKTAGFLSRGQPDPVVDGPSVGAAEGAMEGNAGGGTGPADPDANAMFGMDTSGASGLGQLQFDAPAMDAPQVTEGTPYETTVTAPGGEPMKLDRRSRAEAMQTEEHEADEAQFRSIMEPTARGNKVAERGLDRVGGMLAMGLPLDKAYASYESILAADASREGREALLKLRASNKGKGSGQKGRIRDKKEQILDIRIDEGVRKAFRTSIGETALKQYEADAVNMDSMNALIAKAEKSPADATKLKIKFVKGLLGGGVLSDKDFPLVWGFGGTKLKIKQHFEDLFGTGKLLPEKAALIREAMTTAKDLNDSKATKFAAKLRRDPGLSTPEQLKSFLRKKFGIDDDAVAEEAGAGAAPDATAAPPTTGATEVKRSQEEIDADADAWLVTQ